MNASALPFVIGASALLSTASAGVLFLSWRNASSARFLQDRFERLVRGESRRDLVVRRSLRDRLAEIGSQRVDAEGVDEEVPKLLAQAGLRGREAVALFTAFRLILPAVGSIGAALAYLIASSGGFGVGLVVVVYVAVVVGYLGPKKVLASRAAARLERIRDDVGALSHLMRVLYDCGLSTEQALQVFAREQRGVLPDVSMEMGEVIRQVAAGSDLEEATKEVSSEVDIPELSDFFGLIRQIDRFGGSVQEPLLRFSGLLEDRERTRMQERISKLSAKLTIVMVLFLLPALLVFVGGPGFLAVIQNLGNISG